MKTREGLQAAATGSSGDRALSPARIVQPERLCPSPPSLSLLVTPQAQGSLPPLALSLPRSTYFRASGSISAAFARICFWTLTVTAEAARHCYSFRRGASCASLAVLSCSSLASWVFLFLFLPTSAGGTWEGRQRPRARAAPAGGAFWAGGCCVGLGQALQALLWVPLSHL